MGKRSTTTTKGGKYMNPTDQARKEARRKELKKNKKQRVLVRTAVLKSQNPLEIIKELEAIDDVDFDPDKVVRKATALAQTAEQNAQIAVAQATEKVVEEKRRRLFGTFHRIVKFHEKDAEPKPGSSVSNVKAQQQYQELRRLWHRYQDRRNTLIKRYEAVKNAYNVTVDDIPLPNASEVPPPPPTFLSSLGGSLSSTVPSSILGNRSGGAICPGVPSICPPSLNLYTDFSRLDVLAEETRRKGVRFEDEEEAPPGEEGPILAQSKDVDRYKDEMEAIHRATMPNNAASMVGSATSAYAPGSGEAGRMMMAHGAHLHMPFGAGRQILAAGPQLIVGGRGIDGRHGANVHAPLDSGFAHQNLSTSSQAGSKIEAAELSIRQAKRFEAKPKMRNLLSSVTKLVPTNVKLKSSVVGVIGPQKPTNGLPTSSSASKNATSASKGGSQPMSKDDAYAQFMSEMDDLMQSH